jgi:hypothetical protein
MSSKIKKKKVNDHVEKAAHFFLACKANPARKILNLCCNESKRILLRD